MLGRKFIVENAEAVRQNCTNRGMQADVDRFIELDQLVREKSTAAQDLNRQANEVSKTIGKAKTDGEREERKNQGRKLREQKDATQAEHDTLLAELKLVQRMIPNMAHPDAPIGKDDKANLEIQRGQHAPRDFGFRQLDHLQLAEKHDMIDFEAGAKTTGAGFYFLKNDAVLLELALQQFVVQKLVKEGFVPTTTPDLARQEILEGIGFNPRGNETQIYSVENTDLCLVATAEITLGGSLSFLDAEYESYEKGACRVCKNLWFSVFRGLTMKF